VTPAAPLGVGGADAGAHALQAPVGLVRLDVRAVDRDQECAEPCANQRIQLPRQQPAVGDERRHDAARDRGAHHVDDARVEERLPALEAEVARPAPVQDVQAVAEPGGVEVEAVGDEALVVREVAEVAGGVADVGHRHVAHRGAALPDEADEVGEPRQAIVHTLPPRVRPTAAWLNLAAPGPVAMPWMGRPVCRA